MASTRTVPDPAPTRRHRTAGWCPPWCRLSHDWPGWTPEDDRQHYSEELQPEWCRDGRSRRGHQMVKLRRLDRPGRRGTPEVELHLIGRWNVRNPDHFGSNSCEVGLNAAEARALGVALLDAAELLERPGWNPSWDDAFRSVGDAGAGAKSPDA